MAGSDRFLVGCAQMCVSDDKNRNLSAAERLVSDAARRGARLVVLPEMFLWRGPENDIPAAAETLDGPSVARLAALAQSTSVTLVAGSFYERCASGGLPFNTTVVFGPDGGRLGVYRKIHLFDVSIPGRVEARESDRMRAGDDVTCVDTPLGRLGLSICYDLRFPELYRRLAGDGATMVCVPSAFTHATGAAHWEVLLRARAIENQIYVIAPNQVGPTKDGPQVWGGSSIIDPWGAVLARASDVETVITAEIDPQHQADVRAGLPCAQHARLTSGGELKNRVAS
ncbi:MAG: carbon-nitrogen hydrolase family protein [Candidatus Binatia bacterium]|nr:carbon-nitrogen hydrolase family protein [Candidatus Binatia bacterium]